LKIVPTVIRDCQKDLKDPVKAERLAFDLQYVAKALYLDENERAAGQIMRIATTLTPGNAVYQAILAENLSRSGRVEEAGRILDSLKLDDSADPVVVLNAAQFALRTADGARARAIVERYANQERFKENPHFLSVRARIWLKSGFAKRGARLFQDAVDKEPDQYCKKLWRVVVETVNSNNDAARSLVLEAGKILPEDPLWLCDAASEFAPVDRHKSWEYLKQSVQCDRLCSRAHYTLADGFRKERKFDAALVCLDHLQSLRPYSAEVCFAKARVRRAQQQYAEAVALFRKGIALNPGAASAYLELAGVYSDDRKPDQAREVLHDATKRFPQFGRVWQKEGDMWLEAEKQDLAEKSFNKALSLVPQPLDELNDVAKNEVGRLHASLAFIAYKAGQRPRAIQEALLFNKLKLVPHLPALLKMIKIRPDHFDDLPELKKETEIREEVLLGDALYESRDLTDAIAEYKKAVALNPDDPDLRSYMLNLLTEKGDWSAAASENLSLSNNIVRKIPQNIGDFFGKKNQ